MTRYSEVSYTYAGGSKLFTIPFSYLKTDHIHVYVEDIETTNFEFNTSSQIQVNDTLESGDVVKITRNTPIGSRMVTFNDRSVLNAQQQNLDSDQLFDVVQEIYDANADYKADVDDDIEAIETTANTALTTANTANSTANAANTKATNAVNTADIASANATQAVSTANTASDNADSAVNTANLASTAASNAVTTANAADAKVDEFGEDIEEVIEAAEKINELEEAVATAVAAASSASTSATTATTAAQTATTQAEEAKAKVGNLSDLTTTAKNTVVAAVNEVHFQYSTMPEASATWLNKPIQYIGETTSLTYKWNTITYTSGLDADKPATGYYKATDTSLWYKDGVDITDLVGDYTGDLPTPDATQVGKYKYNTETTVLSYCVINTLAFTHGVMYEVVADTTTTPTTYSWQPYIKTINNETLVGNGNLDLDSKYVNVTGDTMSGNLAISKASQSKLILQNTNVDISGSAPSSTQYIGEIDIKDGQDNVAAYISSGFSSSDYTYTNYVNRRVINGSNVNATLSLSVDADGDTYCSFPMCTTAATTTSTAARNKVATVVKNYKSGTSWYRVWSDGWIEQGGYKSASGAITFLREFTDANYSLAVALNSSASGYTAKTASSFTIGAKGYWYACGY